MRVLLRSHSANVLRFGVFAALVLGLVAHSQAETLLIRNAKIYPAPGMEPLTEAAILIRDGRLVEIAQGTLELDSPADRTINAAGLVVVAGFWNSHVHFTEPHWLGAADRPAEALVPLLTEMLTRHGFTSVVDTGSVPQNTAALGQRIDAGLPGPRILMASGSFVAVGGSPSYLEVKLPELSSPQQAKAIGEEILGLGADGLKIFTGSYLGPDKVAHLDLPLVRAVTAAAHARGAWVMAHPQSRLGVELALDGGVDILAHTAPGGGPWDQELVDRLVEAEVALIPTLQLWRFELARAGVPTDGIERFQQMGVDQLRAFAASGGEVLFGTDAGYMTVYDPTEELQKMHQAGLDFHQILASLTTAPARRFDLGKTEGNPADESPADESQHGDRNGRIEAGGTADLVILGSDPAQDIEAFADVRFTIRGGRVIYESSPPKP